MDLRFGFIWLVLGITSISAATMSIRLKVIV